MYPYPFYSASGHAHELLHITPQREPLNGLTLSARASLRAAAAWESVPCSADTAWSGLWCRI